jgi:hypothetical protein
MKVKFIGSPNSADAGKVCEMFGKLFVVGHEVDVSDLPEAQQRKLAANHHFEVTDYGKTSEPGHHAEPPMAKRSPGRPRKVIADGGDDTDAG